MYDFYFGNKSKIEKNPLKWLLGIKHMLPRFINSIPDSEYEALYYALRSRKTRKKPLLVETGCGASTIVMLEYALKYGGKLYTWDICGTKLAYLRGVINDTLFKHYTKANLFTHWKYIAFDSNSSYAGLSMLKEMRKTVTACFLDSEHTRNVLMGELDTVTRLMKEGGLIAIDDANYSYRYQNTAYINMIRTKHNLPPIEDPEDNKTLPFYMEVETFLKDRFKSVRKLDDVYKKRYRKDIFWTYYNLDRQVMNKLSMEKKENLIHRFDAWVVGRKR